MTLPIPAAALANHIAVLGKTGSGKTWAMKTIVEYLLDQGQRVCIVDPTGAWYGLRTLADGMRAGYPVAIFGGTHGDFPLQAHHGDELAEIIGTTSTPAIIDVSQLRTSERTRLFTDLAEGLLRKNRGPLHLVIDEAHLFAPQGRVADPQSGQMLHAANNLISLGRSRGLRVILISQRPAKVHKDSLTQVETLVAMRLIAPQDRKAVEEWIKDNAADSGRELLQSLASLKTGHGWVWSPEAGVLERVTFPKIRTLDTGRAPDGSEPAARVLAPIDREAIATRLKTVAAEAEANDPAKLKAKVAELEKALRAAGSDDSKSYAARNEGFQEGKAAGYRMGFREAVNGARERITRELTLLAATEDQVAALVPTVSNAPPSQHNNGIPMPFSPGKYPVNTRKEPAAGGAHGRSAPLDARRVTTVTPNRGTASSSLPKGEAAVLAALIQYPAGLRREQLTVLTAYKRSSRDAYIQRLREKGFVDTSGDRVTTTQAGIDAMPDAEPLPTGEALQQFWLARLPEGERKILQVLLDAGGAPVERDSLEEVTGYKRSSRDAYLQRLRAKELIAEPGRGQVAAAAELFQ